MSKQAVSRETALARYDAEFDRWRSALDAVGMDRMDEPGVMGEWSAKQLVAHVAGWQWKTLASLRTALSGGEYPPTPWPGRIPKMRASSSPCGRAGACARDALPRRVSGRRVRIRSKKLGFAPIGPPGASGGNGGPSIIRRPSGRTT